MAIAIVSAQGRVLVRPRPAGDALLASLWEFPGGKVEAGETPATAASREFREETGLDPPNLTLLAHVDHAYPDRDLALTFLRGELDGVRPPRAGTGWSWQPWEELAPERVPAANLAALTRIASWVAAHGCR